MPDSLDTAPPAGPPPASFWVRLMARAILYVAIMCVGAFYGVSMYSLFGRLFGSPSGASPVMLWSFLAFVPLALGLLVSRLARRRARSGVAATGGIVTGAIFLFVFAAGAVLREGTVCIVMALPIFLVLALCGMVLGALVARLDGGKDRLNGFVLVLPLLLGAAEQRVTPAAQELRVQRSVLIHAAPAVVWQLINYPTGIAPRELDGGVAYRIGVPYPIEARTLQERVGGQRRLLWQRGVRFTENITDWQPMRHIAWTYQFDADSFPPGSLDDHVVIGGRYFTLTDTDYTLTPEGRATRLTVNVGARVSTTFNWYAGAWARFLVADTATASLGFYQHRAEERAHG
jgi:hypothetical protein